MQHPLRRSPECCIVTASAGATIRWWSCCDGRRHETRTARARARHDRDIVAARQRARQVSALLGFDAQDQVRIATAVSELARNAVRHGGGGRIEFALDEEAGRNAALADRRSSTAGPASPTSRLPSSGTTPTGELKLGLVAARRLMDSFEIESAPRRGTSITLRKIVPRRAEPFTRARIERSRASCRRASHRRPERRDAAAESRAVAQPGRAAAAPGRADAAERRARRHQPRRDGAVRGARRARRAPARRRRDQDALPVERQPRVPHAGELDPGAVEDPAAPARRRADAEQEKQVSYIRQAADQLSTLVDDLLDLRKVEAGKIQLRVETFTVTDLFGALRGMFKPLRVNDSVALVFDEPADLPELHTDQGKVSQILRNLISNALKFTERGSVRVSCRLSQDEQHDPVRGRRHGHRHRAGESSRASSTSSRRSRIRCRAVKGTGLGLPLSQRLAGLLGGSIEIRSALGQGSTFSLAIPLRVDGERGACSCRRRNRRRRWRWIAC